VRASIDAGARLLLGGDPADGPGAFYPPTVLGAVTPDMATFGEETFGPVASIIAARDADEAIRLANLSRYGLSSALWTGDSANAHALARRLETGGVFINGVTASDPRIPIGGVKNSGYGRELSYFGLREFSNAQIVWQPHEVSGFTAKTAR
jgi:succinate-semialdehyde dehydrogenase